MKNAAEKYIYIAYIYIYIYIFISSKEDMFLWF